jgi:hypothetical protein
MRFEVVTVLKMWIVIIWVVMPCSFVGHYQRSSEMFVVTYKTTLKMEEMCSSKHW